MVVTQQKFPTTLTERLALVNEILRFPASFAEFESLLATCDYPIEYQSSEIIAISIASDPHERIVANLLGILFVIFRNDDDYIRYGSNRHVYIPSASSAFAPDVSMVHGELDIYEYSTGKSANLNPWLVCEVLSPSTRKRDLMDKFPVYKEMASLQHILFVEQDSCEVLWYERQASPNSWLLRTLRDPDDNITLAAQRSFYIGALYQGLTFPREVEPNADTDTSQDG